MSTATSMLATICRELDLALKLQHVPFPVVFGPERSDPVSSAFGRLVIEHMARGDSFDPPIGTHPNPKVHFIRWQGARLRLYARSNVSNARHENHTALAERAIDAIMCELSVCVRARKNRIRVDPGAGFVPLEDAVGSQTWGGVVYELTFAIDRACERRTWEGEAADEVTIGDEVTLTSTTKVSAKLGPAGTPPADAEDA
jgi:hypothetical protein